MRPASRDRWSIRGILIECRRRMSIDREVIKKEFVLKREGHMSPVAENVRRRECRVIEHPRREFNCGTEKAARTP